MTFKYKINPCKACEKKLQGKNCNVNTMNDCCYATLAAFSGATSSNAINNSEAANNCKECVQKVMDGMGVFGRTPCDLKLSAPPLWQQSPHYFPPLLDDNTPEEARSMCMRMCGETAYPIMCKENCQTDYDALEIVGAKKKMVKSNSAQDPSFKASNNTMFVVSVFILVAVLLILLFFARK